MMFCFQHAPGVPRILIGNRLHLEFNRAVPRREAEYFARKRNMQYFEVTFLIFSYSLNSANECPTSHSGGLKRMKNET